MPRTSATNRSLGFTVVEVLVALPLFVIVAAVFISALVYGMQSAAFNQANLEITSSLNVALDGLERDVRYSTGFQTGIASPFADASQPAGGWTHKGTPTDVNKRVLILSSPSTVTNPLALNRVPVYINGSLTNPYQAIDPTLNCSTTPPSGTLYINPQVPFKTIYFVDGTTLYRRILIDTTTTLCNGPPYQKQSCPTGTGGTCTVKDEKILDNVVRFSIDYYNYAEPQTQPAPPVLTLLDTYAVSNPDDIALADNVEITLTLRRSIGVKNVEKQLSLRVNRINSN